ncbi:MAG: hypothetical protein KKB50_05370, partial [Planctomycetes bacterium]|nr:hypothetical protein [Planctomycetota bacterium]
MSSRSWLLALRVAVLALACLLAIGLLAPVGCTGVTTSALLPDMGMQNETSYTQPEPESYALNVTVVGPGSVVEQTSYGTRALQDTYDAWENVRLRAEPDEDARFVRWEGDYGDTDEYLWVYMNGVQTVRAIFEVVIREADVSTWVDPDESGAISVAPAPPYTEGTTVTLTARPEVNWRFRHWNHNESSANPITVVL